MSDVTPLSLKIIYAANALLDVGLMIGALGFPELMPGDVTPTLALVEGAEARLAHLHSFAFLVGSWGLLRAMPLFVKGRAALGCAALSHLLEALWLFSARPMSGSHFKTQHYAIMFGVAALGVMGGLTAALSEPEKDTKAKRE
jgi:hypothetical protein